MGLSKQYLRIKVNAVDGSDKLIFGLLFMGQELIAPKQAAVHTRDPQDETILNRGPGGDYAEQISSMRTALTLKWPAISSSQRDGLEVIKTTVRGAYQAFVVVPSIRHLSASTTCASRTPGSTPTTASGSTACSTTPSSR
jgi:hypothetical protein